MQRPITNTLPHADVPAVCLLMIIWKHRVELLLPLVSLFDLLINAMSRCGQNVSKMLGSVNSIMAKKWNADNPGNDCLIETKAMWNCLPQ